MPRVNFWRESTCIAAVDAPTGMRLLDLIQQQQIPVHWRCGQGTCGTCRVWVSTDAALQPVSRMESNVLQRAVADTVAERCALTLRLACHISLQEANLDIYLF